MFQRTPRRELLPFVSRLWASTDLVSGGGRERVLPTGAMHVVIRLDHPLRLFDDLGDGHVVAHSVIGGARAESYIRDVSQPTTSVGAQLHPGASEWLLGVPAIELAGRHTPLDEAWGSFAHTLRERLSETKDPARRLDLFEEALLSRSVSGSVHPAVARAVARFARTDDVTSVVNEVGYSHRRFIELFRHAVGMTPKVYCRVMRLQQAVARIPTRPLAEVASDAGFSDQAHLSREFRALTGMTPGQYRASVEGPTHHCPIESNSFKTPGV